MLCAQSDVYVQYLHVIESTLQPCLEARVGTLRPIASTGTGIMLLSTMSDSEIERVLRRANHARGREGQPRIEAGALRSRIAEARAGDRLFSSHPSGVSSLAMLLRPAERRTFVVGVIGPTARLQAKVEAIRALVQR